MPRPSHRPPEDLSYARKGGRRHRRAAVVTDRLPAGEWRVQTDGVDSALLPYRVGYGQDLREAECRVSWRWGRWSECVLGEQVGEGRQTAVCVVAGVGEVESYRSEQRFVGEEFFARHERDSTRE